MYTQPPHHQPKTPWHLYGGLFIVIVTSFTLVLGDLTFAQRVIDLPTVPAAFSNRAEVWLQQAKITALEGACGDDFGYSVGLAQNGDTAIIGAYLTDGASTAELGAAYIFTRSGTSWSQQAKLTANDGAFGDMFGFAVAISSDGSTALVGAQRQDADGGKDAGAVYVFTRTGTNWTQQANLTAAVGAAGDEFGYSVALAGETALVGAPLNDDAGADSGSAYVFVRSGATWTQQAKLIPTGGASLDRFGQSVALDSNTAVIGAPFADKGTAQDAGIAVVFTRSGAAWAQQAKLKASDAAAGDYAGGAVALVGDTVLMGAAGANVGGNNAGAVYAFTRSGTNWAQQAKLMAGDANADDKFGAALTLAGDSALIGAPNDDQAALNAGAAYRFIRIGSAWTQDQKLISGDPGSGEQFGSAAAAAGDGQSALVGAFLDGGVNNAFGAAYAFGLAGALPTATPTPIEPSPTPMPGVDLLVNGDFEMDTDANNVPDNWLQLNPISDKLKCNKPGKLFAQAGECAYRFKGNVGENSKLRQDIALTVTPSAGDTLYLSGFVNLSGTPNFKVKVRVTYTDTALPKGKITLEYIAPTTNYLPFSGDLALVLAGTPTLIRIQAHNRALSGKVYLDSLRLTWEENPSF